MQTNLFTYNLKIKTMAVAFNARVYGQIQGTPPYTNADGQTNFSRGIDWSYAPVMNFPAGSGVQVSPLPNGVLVGGAYVYSVIQTAPTGLNVHGEQYVSDSSAATLATARG